MLAASLTAGLDNVLATDAGDADVEVEAHVCHCSILEAYSSAWSVNAWHAAGGTAATANFGPAFRGMSVASRQYKLLQHAREACAGLALALDATHPCLKATVLLDHVPKTKDELQLAFSCADAWHGSFGHDIVACCEPIS